MKEVMIVCVPLVCVLVLAWLCLAPLIGAASGSHLKYSANHAYVPYEWLRNPMSHSEIERRLDELEEFGIQYLLCDIGNFTSRGDTIRYSGLGDWIQAAHQRNMVVLGCINYVLSGVDAPRHAAICDEILNLSRIFTQTGVQDAKGEMAKADGVQLDIEPFRTMQSEFLQLLRDVRSAVGNDKLIGLATPAKNGVWSDTYAMDVINTVDYISCMIYDSCGPSSWGSLADGVVQSQEEYIELVSETSLWYSRLIEASENKDCLYSVTVPVYDDRFAEGTPGYPDPESSRVYYHLNYSEERGETIEKLDNSLTGIFRAIDQGAKIDGAGIFYWPAFLGELRSYSGVHCDYREDQAAWKTRWMVPADPGDSAGATQSERGDANGDGSVNGRDIIRIRKYLAAYRYENGTSGEYVAPKFDANGDGTVTAQDIIRLKKYLANLSWDTGMSTVRLGEKM